MLMMKMTNSSTAECTDTVAMSGTESSHADTLLQAFCPLRMVPVKLANRNLHSLLTTTG